MRKTLIFDLDGTLINSVPDLLASCNRLMAARGLAPFTAPDITAMVGDGAAALVRRVMAARGRAPAPEDIRAFLDDYMAHPAAETRPYPGVEPTLGRLAAAGWTLAVCTNKPVAAARAVLSALDLLPYFAAVAGGDSHPTRKPDPAHLLATLAEAGGTADAAVMAGDHHNDVAAARAAAIPCIFAAWGYGRADMAAGAAATAHAITEIPELAATALARRQDSKVRRKKALSS